MYPREQIGEGYKLQEAFVGANSKLKQAHTTCGCGTSVKVHYLLLRSSIWLAIQSEAMKAFNKMEH